MHSGCLVFSARGREPKAGSLKLDFVASVNDRATLYSSMRSMLAAEHHQLPPIPESLDSRSKVLEATVLRAAALVGALAVIVGLLAGAAGFLWDRVFADDGRTTYAYVANPPVVAQQFSFPNESSPSLAAQLLAPGAQLEVVCRWDTPQETERTWVLLASGTWIRGSEVLPAATESTDLSALPTCDLS